MDLHVRRQDPLHRSCWSPQCVLSVRYGRDHPEDVRHPALPATSPPAPQRADPHPHPHHEDLRAPCYRRAVRHSLPALLRPRHWAAILPPRRRGDRAGTGPVPLILYSDKMRKPTAIIVRRMRY